MDRVIISGANGFIGSTLVKKFYEKGYEVIALIKDTQENVSMIKDYATIIYSELSNIEFLTEQLRSDKRTIFYHLAWIGVNGQQKASYESQIQNIKMTCDCITIAKNIGCTRFLCSGTIAERAIESFQNLDNIGGGMMYAVSKQSTHLFTEMMCKNLGLNYVWMQFSNIYGPSNKTGNLVSYTLGQLMNNADATFGPAMQPYDFIYVEDLIDAVYKLGIAKELKHNRYFIGSGKPRLLKEYLLEIGKTANKENLIKIGVRPDDGIKYTFEMFDTAPLIEEIGNYISKDFSDGIKYTVENY